MLVLLNQLSAHKSNVLPLYQQGTRSVALWRAVSSANRAFAGARARVARVAFVRNYCTVIVFKQTLRNITENLQRYQVVEGLVRRLPTKHPVAFVLPAEFAHSCSTDWPHVSGL